MVVVVVVVVVVMVVVVMMVVRWKVEVWQGEHLRGAGSQDRVANSDDGVDIFKNHNFSIKNLTSPSPTTSSFMSSWS